MSSLWYILLAIVMFGVLVFLHELGHFAAARLTGVGVKEFAMGLGPKIISRVSAKTGIRYSLRALPLGGFCSFYDEYAMDDAEKKRPDSFQKASVWKRMLICASGPLMNLVACVLFLVFLYAAVGLWGVSTTVDSVAPGMPAQEAGFLAGDQIEKINGTEIASTAEAALLIEEAGSEEIEFTVSRDGEEVILNVTPQWSEQDGKHMIGIYYRVVSVRFPIWTSLEYAAQDTWKMSGAILDVLRQLIFTGEGAENLSGPIGTVALISEETQSGGIRAYLCLAAMLSVNLGLFNLLPIPGLDGSRLVFLMIEKLRGKPIDPEKEGLVTVIGLGLLLLLMFFIMYQDIVRLFS